jgi:hypothetical protein
MMATKKRVLILTAAWLGGCATPVPVVDFYDTDSEALDRFRDVQTVYEREGFDDLGQVKGLHCNRNGITPNPHSPEARAMAIDQVRLKAAALGADAITEPHCRISVEMDLTNNCLGSVLCISHALRRDED